LVARVLRVFDVTAVKKRSALLIIEDQDRVAR